MSLSPSVVGSLSRAGLDPAEVEATVRAALAEDLRWGPDVTTAATVDPLVTAVGEVRSRAAGVLAGLPVALAVLDAAGIDPAGASLALADGDRVAPGQLVAELRAPLAGLLTAERTLLNFLTHLSGVATTTRAWVDAVAGTACEVRDTRKTLPGLRELEKYAVRCGGGVNHRLGLGDAALVKDNHVAAAGSVAAAVAAVRAVAPEVPLEVECDTLAQVEEALAAGVGLVLLDNMTPGEVRAAVALRSSHPGARLEASGGLTLASVAEVAAAGVDFVAVGALTHSSPALDLGLDLPAPSDPGTTRPPDPGIS